MPETSRARPATVPGAGGDATMAHPVICTSTPASRLPQVRALARAVAAYHDGEELVVLVADGAERRPDGRAGDVTATGSPGERRVAIDDLDLDLRILHELALVTSSDDFAACLVPALLALLVGWARPVVALAPDTVLLGPLDDVAAKAVAEGIVLVPRLLEPVPMDGRRPSAAEVVAGGAFDPGLVAVSGESDAFLGWWFEALRAAATTADRRPSRAQPELDLAPQLFGAAHLRDPGLAVGYWNAHERDLTWSVEAGYRAQGAPLRTVRLEGFDGSTPQLLAPHLGGRARVLQSGNRALARLCGTVAEHWWSGDANADADAGAALPVARQQIYMAGGTEIDDRMRRIVRRTLAANRCGPGPDVAAGLDGIPDPFDPATEEDFFDWLALGDPSDPDLATLPRYLRELYLERRDLRWHFPRVGTVDMAHFRSWVESHGLDEAGVAPGLRAAIARSAWWRAPTGIVVAPESTLGPGVVLAGYLRAESGVGEAARLALEAMRRAGVDVSTAVLGSTPSRQMHRAVEEHGDPVAVADRRVNLVWTNADQLPGFASRVGADFFAGRYNIGFWAWETERMPAPMAASSEMLDEIWVPSSFVRDAVQPVVDVPVQVFPHPIVAPTADPAFDPASLGIPAGFRFLVTFDFLSSFARKHPLGALEAFTAAFAPGAGPVLVLKSVNGDRHVGELERLRLAASERPDVIVVDGYVGAEERGALLSSCDCYVSLHRAEGFGLGIAEAMALGKPVIATGYSGNLEFMDHDTAMLVPAARVRIGPGAAPYDPGGYWGEPDLAVAARHMRSVVADPTSARALGERARVTVSSGHGLATAERFLTRRLREIDKLLRKGYVSAAPTAVRRML